MDITVGGLQEASVDVIAVAVTGEEGLHRFLESEVSGDIDGRTLRRYVSDRLFSGDPGAVLEWPLPESYHASAMFFVGCGEEPAPDRVRRAFGIAARKARNIGSGRIGIAADATGEPLLAHAVQGAILGGWAFRRHLGALRSDKVAPSAEVSVLTSSSLDDEMSAAVARASLIARATLDARDLVSEPANVLNPQTFAEEAERVAARTGLEITVLQPPDLERIGAGAILGVGQGSVTPPCMIHLVYRPEGEPEGDPIGIVGKCITFDTGGYSIKSGEGMVNMKSDMAGGAAVLGAMSALRAAGCRREVHGVICAAENMISGAAFRPGDVLTAMNGVTIEIVSTDAEGRLVLADGLVYTARQGVSEMIDLATLTGAANVALGGATALFATDDGLAGRLLAAADAAGERTWRMPIYDDFGTRLTGEIADLKNSGGRPGGAVVAARFLQYFTEAVPWAHLDIAGSARAGESRGYTVKGATGSGVRTLLAYLLP
ncbi:MAG TPA: leucyl aminopeptidase [Thermomicrobiales bacterium]|nr:leucyl aminopeptidase [Thermomicrobiales bacterium]